MFWGRLNPHALSCGLSDVSQFQVKKIGSLCPISVCDLPVMRFSVTAPLLSSVTTSPSCGSASLSKLICAQIGPLAMAGMEVKPLRGWLWVKAELETWSLHQDPLRSHLSHGIPLEFLQEYPRRSEITPCRALSLETSHSFLLTCVLCGVRVFPPAWL